MDRNSPICLFDSGIGGLTVLKKLVNNFPNESYIYLADLARVPFGDKSREELTDIVNEIILWLNKFNPKAIITACNTSSALMQDVEIANSKNLISIIDPISKEIAESSYKEVSVWATKFTIENNAYRKAINKLNPEIKVQEISCPKLVPMIENLECSNEEKDIILDECISQISSTSKALIYGCTHYPHIDQLVKKKKNILAIDPADAIVNEIKNKNIANQVQTKGPNISLYTTAQKDKLERFSRLYLCGEYKVQLIALNKVSI